MKNDKSKNPASDRVELRKFGIVMFAGFGVLGVLLHLRGKNADVYFFSAAAAFGAAGLLIPLSLKYIYIAWMKFATLLGKVNTAIILSVFYIFIFSSVNIVMRIFGKDPLNMKWDKKADSYWIPAEEKDTTDKKHYERQF